MLERLRIRNFRGLNDVTVDKLSRINVVTGRNNAGKTTLIEAILLLVGAANARMAFNPHAIRGFGKGVPPRWVADTYWKPLFSRLDTDRVPEISGVHSAVGDMTLTIEWERLSKEEFSRDGIKEALAKGSSETRSLKFVYEDPGVGRIESEAHETTDKLDVDQSDKYVPFNVGILQPGEGNLNEDAVALGQLRMQKRGALILDALRVVEPRLEGIEDNSSSGAPMICVDVGLPELVPLPVMGAGMTHVARIVLAAATASGGVVLVDEIENGLHHSVLPDVWRVVAKVADQFDVQVFATTHSFECLEAAHEALAPDDFRVHRLEAKDGMNRCVTFEPGEIDTAIRHNMEIR